MDIYSAYMCLSGNSLEEVIQPELKQRYQSEKHNWFPRSDTPSMQHMIRGHRGSSRKNTEEMELLSYVVKHIFVLGSRTNSAAKESINDYTISIKVRIWMCFWQRDPEMVLIGGFVLLTITYIHTYNKGLDFHIFIPNADGVSTTPLDI